MEETFPVMQKNSVNKVIFHFLAPEIKFPCQYTSMKIILNMSLVICAIYYLMS